MLLINLMQNKSYQGRISHNVYNTILGIYGGGKWQTLVKIPKVDGSLGQQTYWSFHTGIPHWNIFKNLLKYSDNKLFSWKEGINGVFKYQACNIIRRMFLVFLYWNRRQRPTINCLYLAKPLDVSSWYKKI